MGEEVCACIKLKDNTTVTEDEIKDYCKQHVRNLIKFFSQSCSSLIISAISISDKIQNYLCILYLDKPPNHLCILCFRQNTKQPLYSVLEKSNITFLLSISDKLPNSPLKLADCQS